MSLGLGLSSFLPSDGHRLAGETRMRSAARIRNWQRIGTEVMRGGPLSPCQNQATITLAALLALPALIMAHATSCNIKQPDDQGRNDGVK